MKTRFRVGLLGCGNISPAYLSHCPLYPVLEVATCSDLDLSRAQARAAEFHVPKACGPDELLADPDIDIVVNLAVPAAHAPMNEAILQAGKHAYSEKPFCLDRESGRRVLALAAEKKLRVGCAPDTFLGAGIQTCRRVIEKGMIGQPVGFTAFMLSPGPDRWHPNPEFFYQYGGGPLLDMGPYYLTALINFFGPARRVTAITQRTFGARIIGSEPKRGAVMKVEVPTHYSCALEFEGGVSGVMMMSFDVQATRLPCIEVYGSEGTLSVPDPNCFKGEVVVKRKTGAWEVVPHEHRDDTGRGIGVADMASAIARNRPHRAGGAMAFHVLDIMRSMEESSESGRHITIQSTCPRPAALPAGLKAGEIKLTNGVRGMEFNAYFWIIFGTLLGRAILEVAANLLNLRSLRQGLPEGFSSLYDETAYRRSLEYTAAQTRFQLVADGFNLAVILAFWWSGGFPFLDGLVRSWAHSEIVRGLLFAGVLLAGQAVLNLPFDWFDTFVLEARFGFNRTTPATFWLDRLKGAVLTAVVGGALFALVLELFLRAGAWAWFYGWVSVSVFSLVATFLAPRLIMPLFLKFSPLEDEELRDAIHRLCASLRYALKDIFVVDGSRRSSKANAFFTGFGRNRRIALFDTLLAEQERTEILAILAHEIGHDRLRHIQKSMLLSILQMGLLFFCASIFVSAPGLFAAFGLREPSVYAGLILFAMLYEPLSELLGVGLSWISRRHEYEADAYAARALHDPEPLMSALKKLSRSHLSNLTPHPFYVALHYSHPPLVQRLNALGALAVNS